MVSIFYLFIHEKQKTIVVSGKELKTTKVFSNPYLINKGLSGLSSTEFKPTDLALFIHDDEDYVQYWMPNTLFNICIIFIKKDGLVIGKECLSKFPYVANKENRHLIPKTKTYKAKFVIEIRADSPHNELFLKNQMIEIN